MFFFVFFFFFFFFFLKKHNSITMNFNLCIYVKKYQYVLGNRQKNFLLTLVVHVLLIAISHINVLYNNEANSATMTTSNLKFGMSTDIMATTKTINLFVSITCFL